MKVFIKKGKFVAKNGKDYLRYDGRVVKTNNKSHLLKIISYAVNRVDNIDDEFRWKRFNLTEA